MFNFYPIILSGLAQIAPVPAPGYQACPEFSGVSWTISPGEFLMADPPVKIKASIWGEMLALEALERRIHKKFRAFPGDYPETLIMPIFGTNGILVVEDFFDASSGQIDASNFLQSICEDILILNLQPHGWQVSYSNDLIGGSYAGLPLKADN